MFCGETKSGIANVECKKLSGPSFFQSHFPLKGTPTSLGILLYFLVFELWISKIATKVLCRISGWQTNALKFPPFFNWLPPSWIDDVNSWSEYPLQQGRNSKLKIVSVAVIPINCDQFIFKFVVRWVVSCEFYSLSLQEIFFQSKCFVEKLRV